MAKLTDKAEAVEIQVADPAEGPIVARYDVSRAPMPLVLAIAPNGAITKGLPTQFDEDQLRQAFVSPCTAECMKALQAHKLVLLCVGPASPQGKQVSLPKGVAATSPPTSNMPDHSKVVVLHPGDEAETSSSRAFTSIPKRPFRSPC